MTCNDCTHYAGNGKCRKNKNGTTSPLKVADELKCFEQAEPEKPVLPEETPAMKVCKGCGRELPLDAFWRNRQGVTGYCKDCMKAKHAQAAAKREQGYKECENKMLEQIFGKKEEKTLSEARQSFQEELDRVAPVKSIKAFSDEELVEELRSRGYSGTLTKSETLNV